MFAIVMLPAVGFDKLFESGYGRGQEVVGLFHDKNRVNADIFINVQELDRPRVQLG